MDNWPPSKLLSSIDLGREGRFVKKEKEKKMDWINVRRFKPDILNSSRIFESERLGVSTPTVVRFHLQSEEP